MHKPAPRARMGGTVAGPTAVRFKGRIAFAADRI
jgi:hypothetical protein